MVRVPFWRARSASVITCLISLIPAITAENSMKSALVMPAMILASVVLPVPGGPQKIIEVGSSCSIARRNGFPGPSRCCWPTNSSSVCGRMRSASGAWRRFDAAAAIGGVSKRLIREVLGSRFEVRSELPLAGGFVEEQRAGDGGVETFDAAGRGDGDARVGELQPFLAEARAFVADHQRAGLA